MTVQPAHEDLLDLVRSEHRTVPLRELLHRPPDVLLGCDAAAVAALGELDVRTVFDLATSAVLGGASELKDAVRNQASAFSQYGAPTSDLVREDRAQDLSLQEILDAGLAVLQGVPVTKADQIERALGVTTVGELAAYPPYRAATRIMNALFFPENAADYDPERPADLVPKTGEYPTEKVQYSTLLIDRIPTGQQQLVDILSDDFRPLDLAAVTAADSGFTKVAFGALLTYTQSWYAQGVTLGQLLHSTALAPGESTRIAVVDWSRRSRAGETEVIDERDALSQDTSQNRAISEVTNAVADEAQGGFSESNASTRSTATGFSGSFEASSPLGGLLGGANAAAGVTRSSATSDTHADSYSSSWGRRNVSADLAQKVNERTHQHASSSRSRRASVVKEVSQSEHEELSTRVIANYNHMHALTVQYYEVVQVHRVNTRLTKVDRVVFLPVALTDFGSVDVIRRFQAVLMQAALGPGIREAIRNLDVIELAPPAKTPFAGLDGMVLGSYLREAVLARPLAPRVVAAVVEHAAADAVDTPAADLTKDVATVAAESPTGPAVRLSAAAVAPLAARALPVRSLVPAIEVANDRLWSVDQVAQLSGLLSSQLLRADSASLFLPNDLWVEGAMVQAGGAPVSVVFRSPSGASLHVTPDSPVALSALSSIQVSGASSERDVTATVVLTLRRNGVRFPVELPDVRVPKGSTRPIDVVQVRTGGANQNLVDHLRANRLHYSQAIFRSLTSAEIAVLLSGYSVHVDGEDVPVSQVIDPVPLRYVGNYLAFRMSASTNDKAWMEFLDKRDIHLGDFSEDLVPLGTGGTFAEAILGRSNCAEKLDITRFWNWQDSPIPLQPSDIAPLTAASRATDESTRPGQLSTPIINLSTLPSLPDPQGMAGILAAIQNGNMFRDMSGLKETIGLATEALKQSSAGAATAGQQAGTNMDNLLKATTERQKAAASMITELAKTAASVMTGAPATGGSSGTSGGGSHSQDGAKINYFDKTKESAGSGAASTTGGGASGGAGGSTGGAGSTGGTGSGGAGGAPKGSAVGGGGGAAAPDGYTRNPAARALVDSGRDFVRSAVTRAMDAGAGLLSGDGSAGTTDRPWASLDKERVFTRLHELAQHPDAVSQGRLGLTPVAVFLHHVLQDHPQEVEEFGRRLFVDGVAQLGALKVSPGAAVLAADYGAIAGPGTPHEAEWMLMAALRDNTRWSVDLRDAVDEDTAIRTSMNEAAAWYQGTGYYPRASFAYGADGIPVLAKTPDDRMTMWIGASLIIGGLHTKHAIGVEGPLTIDRPGNSVEFDYWSVGGRHHLSTTYTKFVEQFLGAVTAGP